MIYSFIKSVTNSHLQSSASAAWNFATFAAKRPKNGPTTGTRKTMAVGAPNGAAERPGPSKKTFPTTTTMRSYSRMALLSLSLSPGGRTDAKSYSWEMARMATNTPASTQRRW